MLALFVKILTANDKYSRHNWENFRQQIPTQLSKKQKISSEFLIHFLNCTPNFEDFQKKDEYHNLSISEIIDSERGSYLNL